ncbi:glycosyl hydrolase family 8 [Lactiplantibacillus mudanjiangensis]|uniref:Glycosyl hydrolase family 8 [Lactobacillus sp.] n=1 Tax=Lactiplantibacillus mudanjiangensis TaxID=1296538 RepID=A0A660DYL5_9LACO|nr:glycosyl hydrolase family 8 [Lactiplantibacillus mudanjiangensis]VDG17932.1 glycosyl hydrolase family 8 [Lactobacillus sp.] [Lactiplantibacillus mudanjiangensis]VDG24359.1 glycosyl hydrolase family 8 [Lactobacillus sp.] [Lactiplantibacillus mudanjiangensis]VDG28346.1 glycosyl hydrolase family 8 [Lactobacillus sp.] [Lactiplantibacillus mudanjiangensis]
MRWKWGYVLLLPLLVMLSGCQKKVTVKTPTQAPTAFATSSQYATQTDQRHRQQLIAFIKKGLLTKQGIYTNYRDTKKRTTGAATGHELLSESSGMWLQYLATTKQWKKFQRFYRVTKKTFDDHGQFSYRYDPRTKKRHTVNATLDDLRIIRALLAYDQMHQTKTYRREATQRYQTLVNTSIKDGHLVNYYDTHTKKATTTGSLAYFDLKTLAYFEKGTKKGRANYRKQLTVVQGGYLGDVFPLYAASYQWTTSKYSSASLNTSEALTTLLHLAEVGKLKATSRRWLVQRLQQHNLENGYTTTGTVSVGGESAANYALAAMIFAAIKDQSHYQLAMKDVWRLQVTKSSAAIVGGIGDAKTDQAYSYNNLTALNAALK